MWRERLPDARAGPDLRGDGEDTLGCTFHQGPRVGHRDVVLHAPASRLVICAQRPQAIGLQTQWLGQVLQGAVNIEQSRLVSTGDLSTFTGPVVAGTEPQRRALRQAAGLAAVMDIYGANARLLRDGPGRGRVFYYDPHSKEYTGQLNVLKGWCGRRHGVTKTLHLDMIHTQSGRPCFAQHYSPYYDLRERFFMTVGLFDELFPAAARRGRLFVLDRGIYGLDTFGRFGADYLLTWEKGYRGDGWDGCRAEVVFSRVRARNHAADLMLYRFECREEPWRRDPAMRRILVRATNPNGNSIAVAILCSDPDIDIETAVWLMFNRWLQENDFKYLDRHFGLNQLTSYASKAVAEEADRLRDMPVDCPEYRELKAQERAAENELARALLKREAVRDSLTEARERLAALQDARQRLRRRIDTGLEQLHAAEGPELGRAFAAADSLAAEGGELRRERLGAQRTHRRVHERLQHVQQQVSENKQHLADLQARLSEAVRQQSRLRLLIDNRYRLLDSRCKEMLDALRISASNMFAALVAVFRPIYGNYRNDHVMLRNLTRADGFLHNDGQTLHVRLWLKGRFQDRQLKAFRAFLAEMSDRLTAHRPPGSPPVRINLLEHPPHW